MVSTSINLVSAENAAPEARSHAMPDGRRFLSIDFAGANASVILPGFDLAAADSALRLRDALDAAVKALHAEIHAERWPAGCPLMCAGCLKRIEASESGETRDFFVGV